MEDRFTLKSGAIKRVFIEEEHDEAVIMNRDGEGDYAIDAGGLAIITAITNFEHEYPEAYKKFMEVYNPYDESQEICITPENAGDFLSLLDKLDSLKPS